MSRVRCAAGPIHLVILTQPNVVNMMICLLPKTISVMIMSKLKKLKKWIDLKLYIIWMDRNNFSEESKQYHIKLLQENDL